MLGFDLSINPGGPRGHEKFRRRLALPPTRRVVKGRVGSDALGEHPTLAQSRSFSLLHLLSSLSSFFSAAHFIYVVDFPSTRKSAPRATNSALRGILSPWSGFLPALITTSRWIFNQHWLGAFWSDRVKRAGRMESLGTSLIWVFNGMNFRRWYNDSPILHLVRKLNYTEKRDPLLKLKIQS